MLGKKNYLVTGGAGFIGSTFIGQVVAKGHQVYILDALTYAGHKENLDYIQEKEKYELIVGNICNKELVLDILSSKNIDILVNFAAESHVDNSITASQAFIETNINGTYNLLEASRSYFNSLSSERKRSFKFIQISTDEVYGSLGDTGKFTENYPMQPNSPYSASKAAGDHLARAWFETYGLPTIVTNCSNNYGPRQFPEKLIPKIIINALSEQKIPIYGDGKNIRDWIHVEDHCYGVNLAIEKGMPGQVYCFGGNAEKTNIELAKTICEILDSKLPRKNNQSYIDLITFVQDRLGHDRRYAIDDSKAQIHLGFNRKYNLEEGLKATVDWYINNFKWSKKVAEEVA